MTPNPRAASRYAEAGASTATPATIVRMLYDGILRFSTEARAALARGDRERGVERCGRATAILEELASTLDRSAAPEVADGLLGLYGFCLRRIADARGSGAPEPLDEVLRVTRELRDTWAEVEQRATSPR